MRYDEFIESVLDEASLQYPVLFNNRTRAVYALILKLGAGALLKLADTLTSWKWYLPRPFKVFRGLAAATTIYPIIKMMRELDMLNKDGIIATAAVVFIVEKYRGQFRSCNNDKEQINILKKCAYDDLLSYINRKRNHS